MSLTTLRKLSVKDVIGNVRKYVLTKMEDGELREVARIFGTVTEVTTGDSIHGTYIEMKGTFGAISTVDEEMPEFTAPRCFLPAPLDSLIYEQMYSVDTETGERIRRVNAVDFVASVAVRRRDELATVYEYVVSPLTDFKQPALAHLLDIAKSAKSPRLAAPEPQPALESEALESEAEEAPKKSKK